MTREIPVRRLRIDGINIPLREGSSIQIVGSEIDPWQDDVSISWPIFEERNVEVDGYEIGRLRECILSEHSITVEATGPINPEALAIIMGFAPDGRTDREIYEEAQSRIQTKKRNRKRAFVGDRCIAPISEGQHESQYDNGHWLCTYCGFDTCLPGDCPEDHNGN